MISKLELLWSTERFTYFKARQKTDQYVFFYFSNTIQSINYGTYLTKSNLLLLYGDETFSPLQFMTFKSKTKNLNKIK